MVYFTNKLIFSIEGLTLQIKRKGCKVKVKVLELSEEFEMLVGCISIVYSPYINKNFIGCNLAITKVGDKLSRTFPTEQEAIDWVDGLFSLRGE
jgi:hypothetical protein